jgi:hypothetical protein
MHRVERLSIRGISRRTGLHRRTVRRALTAGTPPRYARPAAPSELDPFRHWICEQLQADPTIQSLRLREMAAELGDEGGETIFGDYVREMFRHRRGMVTSRAIGAFPVGRPGLGRVLGREPKDYMHFSSNGHQRGSVPGLPDLGVLGQLRRASQLVDVGARMAMGRDDVRGAARASPAGGRRRAAGSDRRRRDSRGGTGVGEHGGGLRRRAPVPARACSRRDGRLVVRSDAYAGRRACGGSRRRPRGPSRARRVWWRHRRPRRSSRTTRSSGARRGSRAARARAAG